MTYLTKPIKTEERLQSPNQGELLAVPMEYLPEKRLAFRIIRGSIHMEKNEGYFPPIDDSKQEKNQPNNEP